MRVNKEHLKKVLEARRLDTVLQLRMSKGQKIQLELDAKKEGMTTSKYIRTKLGLC